MMESRFLTWQLPLKRDMLEYPAPKERYSRVQRNRLISLQTRPLVFQLRRIVTRVLENCACKEEDLCLPMEVKRKSVQNTCKRLIEECVDITGAQLMKIHENQVRMPERMEGVTRVYRNMHLLLFHCYVHHMTDMIKEGLVATANTFCKHIFAMAKLLFIDKTTDCFVEKMKPFMELLINTQPCAIEDEFTARSWLGSLLPERRLE